MANGYETLAWACTQSQRSNALRPIQHCGVAVGASEQGLHLPILMTLWVLLSGASSPRTSSSSCMRIMGCTLSLGGPAGSGSEAARGLLTTSKSPSLSSRAPSRSWPVVSAPAWREKPVLLRPLPGGDPVLPVPAGGSSVGPSPQSPPSAPGSVSESWFHTNLNWDRKTERKDRM